MKRPIAVLVSVAALAVVAGGCSDRGADPAGPSTRASDGWIRPPAIRSVERRGAVLVFHGRAEPNARVVLRSDAGAAYAAAADADGTFDIRMTAAAGDQLLQPETQVGQDAVLSPERLLIVAGGHGPIALVRAGGPTRRLDRAPALGAVDSDGRAMLASGMAPQGRAPAVVRVGDGEQARPVVGADGRWTALLGSSPGGAATVAVGAQSFAWPGVAARASGLSVERAGAGWRVGWPGPAGAWQTTWLPDAA